MGRGKSRASLELIDAAYSILAEIQRASVRAKVVAPELANDDGGLPVVAVQA